MTYGPSYGCVVDFYRRDENSKGNVREPKISDNGNRVVKTPTATTMVVKDDERNRCVYQQKKKERKKERKIKMSTKNEYRVSDKLNKRVSKTKR